MKVLYFAQAAQAAGCREEEWDGLGPMDLETFWSEAIRRHPALNNLRSLCRVASGMSYLGQKDTISGDGDVAVIPPVSGG